MIERVTKAILDGEQSEGILGICGQN